MHRSWKNSIGLDGTPTSLSFVAEAALENSPDTTKLLLASKPELCNNDADTVYIIEPLNPSKDVQRVTQMLTSRLRKGSSAAKPVSWPVDPHELKGKSLVSLLELEQSVLAEPSTEDFDRLKAITLQSSRMLWVSMGEDPITQTAVGHLRVLQNENVNLDLRYLQLEQNLAERDSSTIADLISRVVAAPSSDREYIEVKGALCINRWVPRYDLSGLLTAGSETQSHDYIKLGDAPATLKLIRPEDQSFELYHFDFDDSNDAELAADEVEIEVKAIAVK